MPYIPPDIIAQAKCLDLLTYLQNYEPNELIHLGGENYSTKSHNSLKISNGKWCWFSQGIGGKTALDYLIHVRGFSFLEAVNQITGQAASMPPVFVSKEDKSPKILILPEAHVNNDRAVRYLHSRGIDRTIIDFCITTGHIYESTPYHNAVFVGFDKSGTARYANLRGIGTDFKGDAKGSDKRYSFGITSEQPSDTLHLFESAIDLLSYATLQKISGLNWNADNLLSLAGVYKPRQNTGECTLPLALSQHLSDYPHIKNIVLRLDNDQAGRLAAQAIKSALPKAYTVTIGFPPAGKDYNDYLCMQLGLPTTKKMERVNIR